MQWALTLDSETYSRKFFENGANAGGILELPLGMTKKGADNLVEGFYKHHTSVQNAFKTVVLREGAKFHKTQVNPSDAELNELRQQQIREVARWYNLPPHKLGDGTNASYNSLEQENKSYLDSTLSPWLTTITTQCESKLLVRRIQSRGTIYFQHDTRKLEQAEAESLSKTITTLVAGGIINPDEGRAWLGLNARPDGEGDQYYYSNNMQPVGEEPEPVPMLEEPVEEPEEPAERTCVVCGKVHLNRTYCSSACRQKAYRQRKKDQNHD